MIRPVTNKLHAHFKSLNKTLSGYKLRIWTVAEKLLICNFKYTTVLRPTGPYMDLKSRPKIVVNGSYLTIHIRYCCLQSVIVRPNMFEPMLQGLEAH